MDTFPAVAATDVCHPRNDRVSRRGEEGREKCVPHTEMERPWGLSGKVVQDTRITCPHLSLSLSLAPFLSPS